MKTVRLYHLASEIKRGSYLCTRSSTNNVAGVVSDIQLDYFFFNSLLDDWINPRVVANIHDLAWMVRVVGMECPTMAWLHRVVHWDIPVMCQVPEVFPRMMDNHFVRGWKAALGIHLGSLVPVGMGSLGILVYRLTWVEEAAYWGNLPTEEAASDTGDLGVGVFPVSVDLALDNRGSMVSVMDNLKPKCRIDSSVLISS